MNPVDETMATLGPPPSAPQSAPVQAAPKSPLEAALDSILEEERAARETQLRVSMKQAGQDALEPDRAAEVYRLSNKYGLPVGVVVRNFDAVQRRDQHIDTPYAEMLDETPALAKWASNPTHAAIAKDDLPRLGVLESLLKTGRAAVDTGTWFGRAVADEAGALARKAREAILPAAGAAASTDEVTTKPAAPTPPAAPQAPTGPLSAVIPWTSRVMWSELAQHAPLVATLPSPPSHAAPSRDPVTAGVAEFKRGVEDTIAGVASFFYGLVREIPLTPAAPGSPRGGPLGQAIAAQVADAFGSLTQAMSGATATGAQARTTTPEQVSAALREGLYRIASLPADLMGVPVTAIRDDLIQGNFAHAMGLAVSTGTLFGVMGAKGSEARASIHQTAADVARVLRAQEHEAFFTALGEHVAQSKTITRSPEAAQTFLDAATKDGPVETVYAPVATFTAYWQARGLDPATVAAELTGRADAYASAMWSGEDLPIPTARYAAQLAGTEHNAVFAKELRVGPGEMNGREAAASLEQITKATQEAPAQAPAAGEVPAPAGVNEPIAAMEDIGAAAARMLAEDPDILRKAEELRRQALETPRGSETAPGTQAAGESQPATAALPAEAVAPVPSVVDPNFPTRDLHVDPQRFQYKQNVAAATGVRTAEALKGEYNPDLGGVVLAWRDPADGQVYVVNGHHRVDLAKRKGVKTLLVRFIDAATATEARTKGALTNIAEGRGDAVDAGKLFRDSGLSESALAGAGLELNTAVARDGLALRNLTEPAFTQVATGQMKVSRGAAIGRAALTPEQEAALLTLVKQQERRGTVLSDKVVHELAIEVKSAATVNVSGTGEQATIFDVLGDQEWVNTAVEKATLRSWLKELFAKDRRTFGFVAQEGRAARLREGGNVIDVAHSRRLADEAAQQQQVFESLVNAKGPINDALTDAAVRLAKGEHASDIRPELLERVRAGIAAELGRQPTAPAVPVLPADVAGGVGPGGGHAPAEPAASQGGTADVLTTGEIQPRLPGAEAVRETNIQTPAVASAPFTLAAPDTAVKAERLTQGERQAAGQGDFLSMPSGALVPRVGVGVALARGQMRPSEIVAALSKSLDGLPVRVGRFRQHALGIYKVKEQVVRLKVANDLQTLSHEIGHHIDESVVRLRSPQVNGELEALGAATSRPSYTKKMIQKEGAAEFMRLYLSDPLAAVTRAPNYFAAFESALAGEPLLRGTLLEVRRQYQGYLALDPIDRVKAHIDWHGVTPQDDPSLVSRMQVAWVDDLAPLKRVSAGGYELARLSRGSTAKADGFLRYGVRLDDGTKIAEPLEAALKPVHRHLEDFSAYLVASRAVELAGRGIETGIDLADAQATVNRLASPDFNRARDAVYAYQDAVVDYAVQGRAISPEMATQMRVLNQQYVPFKRVQDVLEGKTAGGGSRSKLANQGVPFKRVKGSGADIQNPLESIIQNTHTIVSMVEKNRAMLQLVDEAAATPGGGHFLEKIPPPQQATRFNLSQVEGAIRRELDVAGVEVPDNLDLDAAVTVFTPATMVMGDQGIVSVIRDGAREWYAVNDRPLYDAIAAVGVKQPKLIINLLVMPARLLRAGATTTVGFIARNPIRDTLEAAINSEHGFRPGWDTLRGLGEFWRKGEDFQQWLNAGGGQAALVSADRNLVRTELRKLADKGPESATQWAATIITSPVELLRAVSEAMENATRLGEFKRAVEAEGRTPEGYRAAALAARNITIDFARAGRLGREANAYVAFFNANVQGAVRLAEVFHRNPAGATTRAVAALTIPTLALWYLNKDNAEYAEIPAWERATYWHIPLGPGRGFARLPKPFSLGSVFANVPQAAIEWARTQDPRAFDTLLPDKNAAWSLLGSVVPTALVPMLEAETNYDTFRQRPIVSPYDTGLAPELQYNRWTSETAKQLGKGLRLSPALIDHLIYGYTAGFGQGVVQVMDAGLHAAGVGETPLPGGPSRWPGVGTFYREGGSEGSAESLTEFYDARDAIAGLKGTAKRYREMGDTAGQQSALAALRQYEPGRIAAADKHISALRDMVARVHKVPVEEMPPDEKRAELNRLWGEMVNTARMALGKPRIEASQGVPKGAR